LPEIDTEKLKKILTPEFIEESLKRSAAGAAEVHCKYGPRQYRCCPRGCCYCRRY
jgi:hypothetical protein